MLPINNHADCWSLPTAHDLSLYARFARGIPPVVSRPGFSARQAENDRKGLCSGVKKIASCHRQETAVTRHQVWLLPSPARATRACPLPGQGEGSEMDTETQSEEITNSENDSLLVESYLRGNNTSGSSARNYDPSSFISSAEKLDHVRVQVGSRESLLEALHDSRDRGDPIDSLQNLSGALR